MGQWQNVTAQPECDIVEVQCKENAKNDAAIFYNFLHAQIYHKRQIYLKINKKGIFII
jgi:hypothetical protein